MTRPDWDHEGGLLAMFLRRSRRGIAAAVLAGLVSGAATAALIAQINSLIRAPGSRSSAQVGLFITLCLVRLLTGIACHLLLIRLSQGAIFEMRIALCRTILAAPLDKVESVGAHRLTAAFTEDMQSVANVVVNLPYLLINVVVLCGCLVYIGWLAGMMVLGILLCLFGGAASYLLPVLWANRRLRLARRHQDELFRHFRALSEGVQELKMHRGRRRALLDEVLLPAADRVRRHNTSGIAIYASAANWNRLLYFVYVGLLLFLFPSIAPITRPELVAFVLVVLYMMAPLEAVMNVLPHLAQANVALRHVASLGLSLDAASPPSDVSELPVRPGDDLLEFSGVVHAYAAQADERPFVLGPIDLQLRSGEIVFLAGGNGSGKTTLTKLIAGLYLPASGEIRVNTHLINDGNRDEYRQLFGAVFTNAFIFDSLLGLNRNRLDARARRHLSDLNLEHKLTIENGIFSTTALSQGQRKRLALLTALLEDRPIYLFDEWAADQDPHFRHVFYTRILPDLRDRGKAVLAVTHDERYYPAADRVLKLHEGRLVDLRNVGCEGVMPMPSGTGASASAAE